MAAEPHDRPMVFVSVGTDHHRFDRLLGIMADWAVAHPDIDVLAQSGHTTVPDGLRAVPFMTPDEVDQALRRATAVVCHGGPSTIMEARAAGHVPIVVARDPQAGEHVDGHQLRFVERIADEGLAIAAQTPEAVAAALGRAIENGPLIGGLVDRPEAAASVKRIGRLLDELIVDRSPHRARERA